MAIGPDMDIAGRRYRALVFDFDGVLADSVEVKAGAFSDLFKDHGPEIQARVADHHRTHGGMTRKEKFCHYHERFLGQPLDRQDMTDLCRRFSLLVRDKVIAAREIPGAGRLLTRCTTVGIPCFVNSAAPDDELKTILEGRGMAGRFQAALGSNRSKAENLEWILRSRGLTPGACLFFGDAASDLMAARLCRVDFIGILPKPDAPLLSQHPDIAWTRDFNALERGEIHGR